MGKITASATQLKPDGKYKSILASKFINCMMYDGKKSVAQNVFYSALDIIKELKDRFADIRILAISGAGRSGPNGYLELALAFGADDALAKPFEMAEFVARVATLCK